MDLGLFKTLGQIAGIGGVALGVFLILFRELIRKSIFPTLEKDDAFRLLRLIAVLIWVVAIVGVASWVYVESRPQVDVSSGVGAGRDVNVSGDLVIQGEKKKSDQ
jgi:hypothetical protein